MNKNIIKLSLLSMLLYSQCSQAEYNVFFINNTDKTFLFEGVNNTEGCDIPDGHEFDGYSGTAEAFQKKKIFRNDYNYNTKNKTYCFFSMLKDTESKKQIKLSWKIKSAGVKAYFEEATYLTSVGGQGEFFTEKPDPNNQEDKVILYTEENIIFLEDDNYTLLSAVVDNQHDPIQKIDNIYFVLDSAKSNKKFERDYNNQKLALLSYNVKIWPPYSDVVEVAGGIYDNKYKERSRLLQEKTNNYDVVTFQEFFDRCERLNYIEEMKVNGEYPYSVDAIGGGSECDYNIKSIASSTREMLSSGVPLFSHWPILMSDTREFSSGSGSDAMARKGIAYAKIDKNGKYYHIFATHTQAGRDINSVNIRKEQFNELVSFIESKNIKNEEPVVIMGDLNVDASSCIKEQNCNEFDDTIALLTDKESITWVNSNTLPYTHDGSKNTMMDESESDKKQYLDYIINYKNNAQANTSEHVIRVIRGINSEKMYSFGSNIIQPNMGRVDLSDHFAIESELKFNN